MHDSFGAPAGCSTGSGMAVLTRRKYEELRSTIQKRLDAGTCDWVMQCLCAQLDFDPTKKIYTPELGQRQQEGLRRKAALYGMNVSEFVRARKAGTLPPPQAVRQDVAEA